MKKTLLTLILSVIISSAIAQSGGPDAFGYVFRDTVDIAGPDYNWIDITGLPGAVQVTGLADDNTAGFFPIGFQFPYYWYEVSQFKVGSNGYMIFSNSAASAPFPVIPAPSAPNDFVAPFMADLNFGGAGNPAECWYWSNQTDTLILSFINLGFWVNSTPAYSGLNTFQIILSKVDSSITFQYGTQQGTSTGTGNFLSIGIENNSGAIGLQQALNTYPAEQTAVKYYYPSSSTFVVSDASLAYSDNATSGGIFRSNNGAPYYMAARIQNTGNQGLSSFPVLMQLQDALGNLHATQTFNTTSSVPGQTEDLVATTPFAPTTAGTYAFLSFAQLPGDATPSNDNDELEIVVVDTTQPFIKLGYGDLSTGTGVSWQGGDAGAGVEIRPPFYPIYLRQIEFFIAVNDQAASFYALLYDNTGPNGTPGNLLDSIYVPAIQVSAPDSWNVVNLTTQIQIDSGSVFVGWIMDGEGIVLGTDLTAPISNRSYEVLGSWDIYRDRETQDPMIRLVTTGDPTTGISSINNNNNTGEFYPSPSAGKVSINLNSERNFSEELTFAFYDIQGKKVETKKVISSSGKQVVTFDVSALSPGVYICRINDGKSEYNRKLVVNK